MGGLRGSPPIVGSYYAIVPVDFRTGLPMNTGIRHCNAVVTADRYTGPGNEDFEWRVTEAENEDAAAISLQPRNYFFWHLSAAPCVEEGFSPYPLCNTGTTRADVLPDDLSWLVVPSGTQPQFFRLQTQSKNASRAGKFMTLSSNRTAPCVYQGTDVVLAPQGAGEAGNGTTLTQAWMFIPLALTSRLTWTTERHDNQNSGFSGWDGPGESAAVCHEQMIREDLLSPTSPRFFSSGITSAVDGWWFGGDSSNTLYLLEDLLVAEQGDEAWQGFSLNLTALSGASPATPWGVVGAPAAAFPADFNTDAYDATRNAFYVASADGWLYAIQPTYCFNLARPFAAKNDAPAEAQAHDAAQPAHWAQAQAQAPTPRAAPASMAQARLRSVALPAAVAAAGLAPAAPAAPAAARSLGRGRRRGLGASASPEGLWQAVPGVSGGGGGAGAWALAGASARRRAPPLLRAAPNGGLWTVYKDINAVYDLPGGAYVNGTTPDWPDCMARCWADYAAKGGLGSPLGCTTWTWHDASAIDPYKFACVFKPSEGFQARPQGGHVTGTLTVADRGPACVKWQRAISAAQRPSYASARVLSTGSGTELVLASETDAQLDTGGVLHAYASGNGSEAWYFEARWPPNGSGAWFGLKGVLPAQHPALRDLLLLAYGPALVALNMSACAGGGTSASCAPVANWSIAAGLPGASEAFVSSPALLHDGSGVLLHSSGGTLWRVNMGWDPVARLLNFSLGWACRYDRAAPALCSPPPAPTVEEQAGPVEGGWYQPTTRAQRDALHAAIEAAHAARFGAGAGGAAASPTQGGGASARIARLAAQLPPQELTALAPQCGGAPYARLRADGRPGGTPSLADWGGLYPFASPALYWDSSGEDARVATVDFRLDADSGLFVVSAVTGVPVNVTRNDGTTAPFAVLTLTLADGSSVPFGRSRSSPAFDRQRHVYVGTDTDVDNNPLDNATYPVLLCADDQANVKWAIGMGDVNVSQIGAASPVVAQGPRGDERVYMVSSDGVQSVIEAPTGVKCPASANGLLDCSGHGDCDCATGTCVCLGCWGGSDCSEPATSACTDNGGQCSASGACVCADACSSGLTCAIKKSCGNGGTCNPTDGSCSCPGCITQNAWGLCAVFNATSAACGGQACGAGGVCNCSAASCTTGSQCGQPLDCVNGACNAGSGCRCKACWDLDAAGTCTVARDCGPNAHCSALDPDGSCVCDACWGRDDVTGLCTQPKDCGPGGVCDGSGSCTCTDPCYTKDADGACTVKNACSGHGACSSVSGACTCTSACYSGASCEVTNACSGRGTCSDASGQCVCSSSCYSGPQCEITQACSGHGTCNPASGACVCDNGCYTGTSCERVDTCGGHGTCSAGGCTCSVGWAPTTRCASCDDCHAGADCSGASTACSRHGDCRTSATGRFLGCNCTGGYSGATCAVPPPAPAGQGGGPSDGAVAAGVLAALAGLGAAGVFFVKRRHPGYDVSAALARGGTAALNSAREAASALQARRSGFAQLSVRGGGGAERASPPQAASASSARLGSLQQQGGGAAAVAAAPPAGGEKASLLHSARQGRVAASESASLLSKSKAKR